ncbi:twin-arginine translocase subunit TatB [Rhizobium sp. TH2]|uniref:Sec-independent protein translocase protein TatB n=1 Tax=Rhizobium sp. TH2 TaxID=2775403 RepID=UPI00215822AB|nr:Sec-independent protein translocase protein TatB [Rhizobium sp. TH2]UVC10849.1 twin-arginine translocase subunit TatB [Rhizobium sp. TH2]
MLEVGWSEILVIALILIIVVGPKDLPGMLRNFGKMATRVRSMANDFKGQFDQAMREAELEDVTKGINEVRKLNPSNSLRDAINPLRQLGEGIKSDLQKASDFTPKASADTGTKVGELTSDPVINPEPVMSPIPPAAAMPVISGATSEAKPKKSRKKPDATLQTKADALASEPVALEPAPVVKKAPARKKAEPAKVEADPFPPPARKTVGRKPVEKHTEHNVHVVSSDAAAAPVKKPAPRKKAAKAGDA